jgi:hypothetical protein
VVPTLVPGIHCTREDLTDEFIEEIPEQSEEGAGHLAGPPNVSRGLSPGAMLARAMAAQFVDTPQTPSEPDPIPVPIPEARETKREISLAEPPVNGHPRAENYLREAGP